MPPIASASPLAGEVSEYVPCRTPNAGEGLARMRARDSNVTRRCEYRMHDAVGRFIEFPIPESQYAKSAALEKCRSHGVVCDGFGPIVQLTVELYNEPRFEAHEIDDVRTDRLLAAKFMIADVPVSEH
jgi:hypothetical protein